MLVSTIASCLLAFSFLVDNGLMSWCLKETLFTEISLFHEVGYRIMVLVQCSSGAWWRIHNSKLEVRN